MPEGAGESVEGGAPDAGGGGEGAGGGAEAVEGGGEGGEGGAPRAKGGGEAGEGGAATAEGGAERAGGGAPPTERASRSPRGRAPPPRSGPPPRLRGQVLEGRARLRREDGAPLGGRVLDARAQEREQLVAAARLLEQGAELVGHGVVRRVALQALRVSSSMRASASRVRLGVVRRRVRDRTGAVARAVGR